MTNRDRSPTQLEITKSPWPVPPLNLFMRSGYRPGVFDLTWDSPTDQALNASWQILGVNVYRSFDSEYGPFHRLTDLPVGALSWRDETDNELLTEDVSGAFLMRGDVVASGMDGPRYVFRTLHSPIVKEGSQEVLANSPLDVWVTVDGVPARVKRVYGKTGEIEIDAGYYNDIATQQKIPPVIPSDGSVVECTYRYTRSFVKTDLAQRIFYRITTVGILRDVSTVAANSDDVVETPLEHAVATNTFEVEKLDYIWREAIRRNKWILEQGGERVKVFIQKTVGVPCPCTPDDFHGQALSDCPLCFGVGIMGGYEGPYDLLIAPDDEARNVSQKDTGRSVEHAYETWTGPSPLLRQRDFLVKINGERYSIGPVRMPNNRGNILQQHFPIGHLDEKDIRYKVPVGSPVKYPAVQWAPQGPETEAGSDVTGKENIPDERELKGRSKAWENIEY